MNTFHWIGLASMFYCVVFTLVVARMGHNVGQTPQRAVLEAWKNIVVGFGLNYALNIFIIPSMTSGGHMTWLDNFCGGWIYTAASLTRSYVIRRIENAWQHRNGK